MATACAFVVVSFLAAHTEALSPTPTRPPTPARTGDLGTRSISGRVTDPDGRAVAAAGVHYRHVSGVGLGSSGTTATDADGRYAFTLYLRDTDNLTITVRVAGYREASIRGSGIQFWLGAIDTNFRLAPNCPADCDGDGRVAVDELILGVNIALGGRPLSACSSLDADFDGTVAISDLISAVRAALEGCPTMVAPTPTPTPLGACRDAGDCVAGSEYCRLPDDPNLCGICLNQDDECVSDADCKFLGEPGICIEAGIHSCPPCSPPLFICEFGCTSDFDCRAWERCGADHHCGPVPCTTTADCPDEFDCAGRACARRECLRDEDCDAGPCLRGRCYSQLGSCELLPP